MIALLPTLFRLHSQPSSWIWSTTSSLSVSRFVSWVFVPTYSLSFPSVRAGFSVHPSFSTCSFFCAAAKMDGARTRALYAGLGRRAVLLIEQGALFILQLSNALRAKVLSCFSLFKAIRTPTTHTPTVPVQFCGGWLAPQQYEGKASQHTSCLPPWVADPDSCWDPIIIGRLTGWPLLYTTPLSNRNSCPSSSYLLLLITFPIPLPLVFAASLLVEVEVELSLFASLGLLSVEREVQPLAPACFFITILWLESLHRLADPSIRCACAAAYVCM